MNGKRPGCRISRAWISEHRWPAFIVAILGMSITAQAILVYFATRPDAPRPEKDFYDRSLAWDEDQAVVEASRQLGWRVAIDVPTGVEYVAGMAQPVDIQVADRGGAPVTGLAGRIAAIRPADTRLSNGAVLSELLYAPGRYRALLRFPAEGLWEIGLDASQGSLRFVHRARVDIRHGDAGASRGGAVSPGPAVSPSWAVSENEG